LQITNVRQCRVLIVLQVVVHTSIKAEFALQ